MEIIIDIPKMELSIYLEIFKSIEICPVRGNLETVFNLTPLRRLKFFILLIRFFDKFFSDKQSSGYNIFLIK